MNNISALINEIAKEKQLSKKVATQVVEKAFTTIINKKFKGTIKVEALYNPETDQIRYMQLKKVVENNTTSPFEIKLNEAKTYDSFIEVDDELGFELSGKKEISFNRNDVLHLKQVISSLLINESKQEMLNIYANKLGKIMSGTVKKVLDHAVIIDLGKTEAILPTENLISTFSKDKTIEATKEKFRVHDKITAVLDKVSASSVGSELILSRISNEYVEQLLTNEVPEIEDGTIVIEKIARIPGRKTKVIVSSSTYNEKQVMHIILGSNGYRIQQLCNQMNNESLTIVVQGTPKENLTRLLEPAQLINVVFSENHTLAIIEDDHMGKFLGVKNQNALLNCALLEKKLLTLTHSNLKKLNAKLTDFLTSKSLDNITVASIVANNCIFRTMKEIGQKMKIDESLAMTYFELCEEFKTKYPLVYDANINASHIKLWKKSNNDLNKKTLQQVREELVGF